MPGKKPVKKPVSKKQAKLFGAVAGGKAREETSMSEADAKRKLKGTKLKDLPEKAPAKKKAKKK